MRHALLTLMTATALAFSAGCSRGQLRQEQQDDAMRPSTPEMTPARSEAGETAPAGDAMGHDPSRGSAMNPGSSNDTPDHDMGRETGMSSDHAGPGKGFGQGQGSPGTGVGSGSAVSNDPGIGIGNGSGTTSSGVDAARPGSRGPSQNAQSGKTGLGRALPGGADDARPLGGPGVGAHGTTGSVGSSVAPSGTGR